MGFAVRRTIVHRRTAAHVGVMVLLTLCVLAMYPGTSGAIVHFSPSPKGPGGGLWSYTTWLDTADFNGDGKLDLAVTGEESSGGVLAVSLGNGDGTFRASTVVPIADERTAVFVTAADLDGDGFPDLAVGGKFEGVAVLLGNGDGTFAPEIRASLGVEPTPGPFSLQVVPSVAVGDLNGDSIPDLVASELSARVVWALIGHGDGTFTRNADYAVQSNPNSVELADLDDDSKLDLVTAVGVRKQELSVRSGNGDGTFGAQNIYPVGADPTSVVLADLTADGKLDAVTANSGERSVSVLSGKGDGTFGKARKVGVGSAPFDIDAGDLNGDVRADLAVANSSDVSVLLGHGDGTFGRETAFSDFPSSVSIADFNSDDAPDLATAAFHGRGGTAWLQSDKLFRCHGKIATTVGFEDGMIDGRPYGEVFRLESGRYGFSGSAGGGDDLLCGSHRADGSRLLGGKLDPLSGGAGDDTIYGGGGRDILAGGPGRDRLFGGSGTDLLLGLGASDLLRGGPGRDECLAGKGRDRGSGCEKRTGFP